MYVKYSDNLIFGVVRKLCINRQTDKPGRKYNLFPSIESGSNNNKEFCRKVLIFIFLCMITKYISTIWAVSSGAFR